MPVITDNFASISADALVTVSGGAGAPAAAPQKFDEFVEAERQRIAPMYKGVVCTTTGVKGGPALANNLYGKDGAGAPVSEQIRGANFLNKFCSEGERLPTAAPPSPF